MATVSTGHQAYEPQCQRIQSNSTSAASTGYKGLLLWSTEDQSFLIAAGFYVSALGMAITTALMPTAAFMGVQHFFIVRFLFGIFENPIYATLTVPLSSWFPPEERSTAGAIYTSGSPLASSLGVMIATNLCSLDFLQGWPMIFYFMSVVTITWSLVWVVFFTNNPKNSKMLSMKEKEFLHEKNVEHSHPEGTKKQPLPLRQIISSTATVAVMAATFSHYFTTSLTQNFLPTYSRDVLALDLKSNGAFTAVTFTFKLASKYVLSLIADVLKTKKIISPTTSCRIFQSMSSFGGAIIFLILALYIDCTKQSYALILLAIYGIFAGAAIPGYFTSSCSFAPMYTGLVTSFTEGMGAIGMLLAPAFVGAYVKNGTPDEWSTLFFIVIAINTFGGLVFLFFGTADIMSWAKPPAASSSLSSFRSQNDIDGIEKIKNTKI